MCYANMPREEQRDEEKQSQGEEVPVDLIQELCDIVDNIEPVHLTAAPSPEPNATVDFERLITAGTKGCKANELFREYGSDFYE